MNEVDALTKEVARVPVHTPNGKVKKISPAPVKPSVAKTKKAAKPDKKEAVKAKPDKKGAGASNYDVAASFTKGELSVELGHHGFNDTLKNVMSRAAHAARRGSKKAGLLSDNGYTFIQTGPKTVPVYVHF